MSVHPLRLLVGVLIAVAAVVAVVGGLVANSEESAPDSMIVFTGVWALLGALVVVLRPRHPVGWLFTAVGLLWTTGLTATAAAETLDPGALLTLFSWWSEWFWIAAFGLMIGSFFIIPTGRVPSRRWRPVVAFFGAAIGMLIVLAMLEDELQASDTAPVVENPIGIPGLPDVEELADGTLLALVMFSAALTAVASQIARYRGADAAERQQLKLVALATPLALAGAVLGGVFNGTALESVFWGVGVLAVPVAVAIAILRYRLFDVDRLISRALVYGLLSVLLGAAYAGLVLAGQAVFSSFAGGSNLAIAVSTLVVAALFLPLRGRVQRFVDRRFYRRRYDAQRTIEQFAARLRQEVDIDSLRRELLVVVDEAMQPVRADLWLRTGPR